MRFMLFRMAPPLHAYLQCSSAALFRQRSSGSARTAWGKYLQAANVVEEHGHDAGVRVA